MPPTRLGKLSLGSLTAYLVVATLLLSLVQVLSFNTFGYFVLLMILTLLSALATIVFGALYLVRDRSNARLLWRDVRDHRLAAGLVLVWLVAAVAAMLTLDAYAEAVRIGSIAIMLILSLSVALPAGILAGWWRLSKSDSPFRLAGGLASGLVAGAIVIGTLMISWFGLYQLIGWSSWGVQLEVVIYPVLFIPGGALAGALGGLVGGLAATSRREAEGDNRARPAR